MMGLDPSIAGVIGQVLTFLAVIAGFVFQYLQTTRQHDWDTEHRRQLAEQAMQAQHTEYIQRTVQNGQLEARVTSRIDASTEAAKAAFKEANDVNRKIRSLGYQISKDQRRDRREGDIMIEPTAPEADTPVEVTLKT